jgi:hypothetical protein
MNPDRDHAVVRVQALERRFPQQDEIGNFSRLDCSQFRVEFDFPCVIDRGSSEDLFERHPGLLKLLHLQIAV